MSRSKPQDGTILIVEPSSYYTSLLRDWLSDLGYKDLMVCASAEQANAHLEDERFLALIIDSRLEDGSGMALARSIRHSQRSPNRMTPVVLLDGRATKRRVSAARDGGASEFVCKPMSRKSFTEHFKLAINDSRSFIKARGFFGPDRRRKSPGWHGDERRRHSPRRVPVSHGLSEA